MQNSVKRYLEKQLKLKDLLWGCRMQPSSITHHGGCLGIELLPLSGFLQLGF